MGEGTALAIGAGVSAVSAGTQAIAAGKLNKRGEKFARDLMANQNEQARIARDWQESMWNKQNEYNDPAKLLERLRNAGINPLGNQWSDIGLASNAPAASASGVSPVGNPNYMNPTQGFNESMMLGAQIQNIMADTKKKEAETTNTEAETKTIDAIRQGQVELQGVQIKLSSEEANRIATLTPTELKKMAQEVLNLQEQEKQVLAEVDKLISDKSLNEAQAEYTKAKQKIEQGHLTVEERQVALAELNGIYSRALDNALKGKTEAETGKVAHEIGKLEAEASEAESRKALNEAEAWKNNLDNEIREANKEFEKEAYKWDRGIDILGKGISSVTEVVNLRNLWKNANSNSRNAKSFERNSRTYEKATRKYNPNMSQTEMSNRTNPTQLKRHNDRYNGIFDL